MNKLNQLKETNKPYSILYLETINGSEIVVHGFTKSVIEMINKIDVKFELVDIKSFDAFQQFDNCLKTTKEDFEGCTFYNANEVILKAKLFKSNTYINTTDFNTLAGKFETIPAGTKFIIKGYFRNNKKLIVGTFEGREESVWDSFMFGNENYFMPCNE